MADLNSYLNSKGIAAKEPEPTIPVGDSPAVKKTPKKKEEYHDSYTTSLFNKRNPVDSGNTPGTQLEPYIPSEGQVAEGDSYIPYSSELEQGRGDYGQAPETEAAPMTDPHRSVLQAIMGWNDVPYGQKWNHYLQHGLVGVSKDNVDNVTQMAQLERMGGNGRGSSTYGQELRAREMERNRIRAEWDKLVKQWEDGRWSGSPQLEEEFYNRAQRYLNAAAEHGMDTALLAMPSMNAGGFKEGARKDILDVDNRMNWLENWMGNIVDRTVEDPNWLNSQHAQMYFDKLSEYTIINWAQSKGAIADAEKIRAQVEAMPTEDRRFFDHAIQMFFDANMLTAIEGAAAQGDQSAKKYLKTLDDFMRFAADDKDGGAKRFSEVVTDENGLKTFKDEKTRHMANGLMEIFHLVKMGLPNVPQELMATTGANKNSMDRFIEYIMQNANVDRELVWNSAIDQYKAYKSYRDKKLPQVGKVFGWEHRGRGIDPDFGKYLAQWQSTDPTARVIRNFKLGAPRSAALVNDPSIVGTTPGSKGGRY